MKRDVPGQEKPHDVLCIGKRQNCSCMKRAWPLSDSNNMKTQKCGKMAWSLANQETYHTTVEHHVDVDPSVRLHC